MSSNIGLVVNPKSGFVGIGTGRPSTLLHVDGNMLAAGTITASNLSILGDFVTLNTITSNTEQMVIQNAGTGPALKVTQTGAHPIADFYDDGQVLAMRIADGGNVGIGTANPLYTLDVRKSLSVASNNSYVSVNAQFESVAQSSSLRTNMGYIQTPWLYTSVIESPPQKGSGTTLIAIGDAGGSLTSLNGNVGTGVNNITMVTAGYERLRVNSDGNVGIGTTNPQSTIDVNGNIKINGSIINTFGRPMLKQIGGILQVVNAVKDPQTLGTQHDIDQITVNITPTSASSKFLVMVAIQGERGTGGITESYLNAHIYRSNSNLIMFAYGLFYNIAISARDCSSSTYLDSPATTSIITYSVRTLRVGPNGTFYVFTGATNITVMEVAG